MSAIELLALQKHYKDQGLSNCAADFASKLAVLVGLDIKELSGCDISRMTGYSRTKAYEYLSQAKLAGLVERKRTQQSRVYSIKVHIPKVFLPCNNGLSQLVMDKLQNAYGLGLVFSFEFVQEVITRSKLIKSREILETVDFLINSEKIIFSKAALYPTLQHTLQHKTGLIIIDSFKQDFSDLNHKQARFIKYLKDVCQIHANANANANTNANNKEVINKLLSTKIFYKPEMLGVLA